MNYRAALRAYAWDWIEDHNRYREIIKTIPNLKPMSLADKIQQIANKEDRECCERGLKAIEETQPEFEVLTDEEKLPDVRAIQFQITILLLINGTE